MRWLLALGALGAAAPAFAESIVADSVEWMAVDAERVVVATVTGVEREANAAWATEVLEVRVVDTLEGPPAKALTVHRSVRTGAVSGEIWAASKAELLLFLDPRDGGGWELRTADGAIDLSAPEPRVAISADFSVLRDRKAVLDRVRAAIAADPDREGPPERGLPPNVFTDEGRMKRVEVPYDSEAFRELYGGSVVYLIIPAP